VPKDASRANSKAGSINSNHNVQHTSIKAALKRPFQGWSKDLLAARDGLDDDYNFTSGRRRGWTAAAEEEEEQ
jgi:hypothetical protein